MLGARPARRHVPAQQPRTRADEVWDHLPVEIQEAIIDKGLDALRDRRQPGRQRGRAWAAASTPSCSPASSPSAACCPRDEAIAAIKASDRDDLRQARARSIVEQNHAAVDAALGALHRSTVPAAATERPPTAGRRCPTTAPDFVQRVTARMLAGEGDLLPVSALPVDGTFRPAPRGGRSARSPPRSRSGTPTSASTAASARSSARTPPSA